MVAVVLGLGLGASARAAKEEGTEIHLIVGEQKTIPAAGVREYSDAVRGVIEVKVPEDGRRLVVTATHPGTTSLVLIYPSGRQETFHVQVFARAPQAVRGELKTLLGSQSGVDVREVGGRIFLDGAVAAAEDLARIERIVALYGGQVASLVTVDPARQRVNIKVDLHFVQLRKSGAYKVGLSWPPNVGSHTNAQNAPSVSFLYTYDFVLRAATQGQLVIAENLLPSLDILGARGWAKVSNVASLVSTDGGTVTYHTGGEVNVRIATSLGASTLQKIPFGVQINVQPRLDPTSREIVVSIDAEQSQLTPIQGQDVPGRILTQTRTNVHVKVGQSIMLSGFQERAAMLNGTGIPLLMRIPVLGYLFRSEAGSDSDTESVLFITPSVIERAPPESTRALEEALRRYRDYGGHFAY